MLSSASMSAAKREAKSAMRNHGPLTTDPVRGCAILIRECGEALDEALKLTSGKCDDGMAVGPDGIEGTIRRFQGYCIENLYNELAQVAATAMTIMTQIEEGQIGVQQSKSGGDNTGRPVGE